MRFNSEAYEKVFPRTATQTDVVESAVETFKPTEKEQEDVIEKSVEDVKPIDEEKGGDDGNITDDNGDD